MPGEDENFLAFATTLKILLGSSIRIDKVPRAQTLLESYLLQYGKMKNLLADPACDDVPRQIVQAINSERDQQQALGTVPDALRIVVYKATKLDQLSSRVVPGNVAHKSEKLDDWIRYGLEHFYNKDGPRVHFLLAANPAPNTEPLSDHARTYEWVLLDGRRITPTSRLQGSNPDLGSSIIQARINDERNVEVRSIFVHPQPNVDGAFETILVAVAWMRRSTHTPLENQPVFIWDKFPELGVETWEYNQYVDPRSHDPPMIMRLADVHCQVSRGRTDSTPKLWITATMDRFPTSLNSYGFGDITEDTII
ncbi:hypothetical protein R3P38DRAFT_2758890 [Favolaschia claudopus]|uniref:Uncharacterized protein n=1 Tax=Favolaschia claudopus TaxID=2862362 RepID=A0AAW0E5T5_9AGAR